MQFFCKIITSVVVDGTLKKLAQLFSKRGLKGAQIPMFHIFDDLLLLLSLFIVFYFKTNFDEVFLCSFLIKFSAWFDLAIMVYEIKRVKESQKRSAIKMFTFLKFKVVFVCSILNWISEKSCLKCSSRFVVALIVPE